MKDLMGMMGKVQEMQAKMGELQQEIENTIVEGTAGGGMVSISMSGKGMLRELHIDDEVEILEDLIIAAHADAAGKAETEKTKKMQELTAGLPIPPGMKLPF